MMHPTPHMSTAVDKGAPKITSGALYEVACMFIPTYISLTGRDRLKSINLTFESQTLVTDKNDIVRF